jgi:branched-chain amino acid transport system ATP-binding protein
MLEVRNLVAGYGDMPVIRDISLSVTAGEILLIGGENGAGKSTLLRAIAGFNRPGAGSVWLEGREVTGQAPEKVAQAGLRLVLDNHRVFPELTVRDNLRLGMAALEKSLRGSFDALEAEIFDVFPILREKYKARARDLSGGQQQILALGQAFVARPKVLMCDEPSMGVAQALLPPILSFLRRWAQSGTAVIIVEQHLKITQPYADRAMIIRRGSVAINCPAADLDAQLANLHAERSAVHVGE